jgi:hypothetical protein
MATILATIVQPSVLFFLIDNDHKASHVSLMILRLCIAIDMVQGWTPRTFAMFLIEDVGPTLIVVEIIACFETNLAPKLAYLISSKDLFMPSITSFCAMASLVSNI